MTVETSELASDLENKKLATDSVYFVQAETLGNIKIGSARNVAKRLKALQCGSPDRLKVLGVIEAGGPFLEAQTHKLFAEHRLHGEWFAPAPALLDFISKNTVQPGERVRGIKTESGGRRQRGLLLARLACMTTPRLAPFLGG